MGVDGKAKRSGPGLFYPTLDDQTEGSAMAYADGVLVPYRQHVDVNLRDMIIPDSTHGLVPFFFSRKHFHPSLLHQ